MESLPRVHVLSDLHLLDPAEPFYQSVLGWLERVPAPGDHLALAGDVFDVFVGNKAVFRAQHEPFFKAISRLIQKGAHVHHVEGNHDFRLRDVYRSAGCEPVQVHGDFIEIQMHGRTLRIEHGDLADSRDYTYLALRRFFRSPLGSLLVDASPGGILHTLGHAWSNGSRDRQPELPDAWTEERRKELRSVYFEYSKSRLGPGKADALVMGHCHDAHECAGYMNVGFPRKHQSWVRWSPESNLLERVPF